MNTPSFLQGAGLALALSLCGSGLYALVTEVAGHDAALRLVIALLAAAYLLFLLRGSFARVGRMSAVLGCTVVIGLSWLLQPALLPYVLIHMGLLWLIRCLYFYRSLASAGLDAALQGLSLAATVWALQETGSLLLSLWSFFLVQALFVTIPPVGFHPLTSAIDCRDQESGFQRAHRTAEAALRRLY